MSLTAASVIAAVTAIRTSLPAATTTVRHNGAEYSATRATADYVDAFGMGGAIQGVSGSVRLIVSELSEPLPKAGDLIGVVEAAGETSVDREILNVRYDQTGATMLVSYGERHG